MNYLTKSPQRRSLLQRAHDAIQNFGQIVGMPITAPIYLEKDPRHPPAYTTGDGIWIREDLVQANPESAAIYFAHEVFHHILSWPEHSYKYDARLVNYADDLIINRYLKELFGYDVTDPKQVPRTGVYDEKLSRMPAEQLYAHLSKGTLKPSTVACGGSISSPIEILQLADHLVTRFDLPHCRAFHSDALDREAYYKMAGLRPGQVVPSVFPVNSSELFRGVVESISHFNPKANFAGKRNLTATEAAVYAFDADKYRDELPPGDAQAILLVAEEYVRHINHNQVITESHAAALASHIKGLENKLSPPVMVDPPSEVEKKVLRWDIHRANLRLAELRKYPSLISIYKDPTQATPAEEIAGSHKSQTLWKSHLEQTSVQLPRIRKTLLMRRLKSLSKRANSAVEASNTLSKFEKLLGPILDDEDATSRDAKEVDEAIEEHQSQGDTPTDQPGGKGVSNDKRMALLRKLSERGAETRRGLESVLFYTEMFLTALKHKPRRNPTENGQGAIYDFSDRVEDAVQSELGLLATEEAKMLFYLKLSQHALMTRSPADSSRNPISVLVDGSGSMHGRPYIVALGFSLAIAKMMEQERRGYALTVFSHGIDSSFVSDGTKPIDYGKVLTALLSPSYGGTAFAPAMLHSLKIARDNRWEKVNHVAISDMYLEDVNANFEEQKREDRLTGISVGSRSAGVNSHLFDEFHLVERKQVKDGGFVNVLTNVGNKVL